MIMSLVYFVFFLRSIISFFLRSIISFFLRSIISFTFCVAKFSKYANSSVKTSINRFLFYLWRPLSSLFSTLLPFRLCDHHSGIFPRSYLLFPNEYFIIIFLISKRCFLVSDDSLSITSSFLYFLFFTPASF